MMKRSIELDVIRAAAILLVLFAHLPDFIGDNPRWMSWLAGGGFSGVDLFFVLSGYLVGGLLLAEYHERGRVSIKRFLIRRGLKIYPAFWIALLAAVVFPITAEPPSWSNIWPELFYLQAYRHGLLHVSWSLSIEEHFYLLLALVIWLLAKHGGSDPFRTIPRIALSLGIICLIARRATVLLERSFDLEVHYTPTHLRIDTLAFGVLIAYLRIFHSERFTAFASRFRWPLLILGVAFMMPAFQLGLSYPRMVSYGFTLLYIGAGMILVAMTAIKLPKPAAWLGKIGQYSYSIYLWHWPVRFLLWDTLSVFDPIPGTIVYFAVSITTGIIASELVEIPVLRIRDRLFPSSARQREKIAPSPAPLQEKSASMS